MIQKLKKERFFIDARISNGKMVYVIKDSSIKNFLGQAAVVSMEADLKTTKQKLKKLK